MLGVGCRGWTPGVAVGGAASAVGVGWVDPTEGSGETEPRSCKRRCTTAIRLRVLRRGTLQAGSRDIVEWDIPYGHTGLYGHFRFALAD